MSGLRELLAHFEISVDDKELKEANEKIEGFVDKLKEFGEVIAGGVIGEKFREFVMETIEAGSAMKVMSERLGVGVEELQKFQLAAQESGATAEDANFGIRFLNRAIGQAADGNKDAVESFQKLKIQFKDTSGGARDVSDVIGDVADKMAEAKTHADKTRIAMEFFGRGGVALLPMLSKGREELEKTFRDFDELGGGMSDEFAERADKADVSLVKLRFAMSSMKTTIVAAVLPYVQTFLDKMIEWGKYAIMLAKHTTIVKTALLALGGGTLFFTLFKLAKLLGLLEGGLSGMLQKLLAFAAPLLIVAGLYLLFDDLYALWEGGHSVIGTLIDDIWGVGTTAQVVQDIKDAWNGLWDFLQSPATQGAADFVVDVFESAFHAMVEIVVTLGHTISGLWKAMAWGMKGNFDQAGKELTKMMDNIGDDDVNFVRALMGEENGSSGPGVASTRTALSMDRTINPGQKNEIEINISGVSDPKAAGEHAGRAVKDALSHPKLRAAKAAVGTGVAE